MLSNISLISAGSSLDAACGCDGPGPWGTWILPKSMLGIPKKKKNSTQKAIYYLGKLFLN